MINLLKMALIMLLCPLIFASGTVSAAGGTGEMSEEQMQEMMKNSQKMQECLENIDWAAFEGLEEQANRVNAEIKALCDAGKRDEAQARAVDYGREISQSEAMQALSECGSMAGGMMNNMPMMKQKFMNEDKHRHICDE